MTTYQLFIGSNNATKKLEVHKIESICTRSHDGFTLYIATGYWKGAKERSAVVTITDTKARIEKTIRILKNELEQDAIGYQILPNLSFA